jgi:periplasmic protein TonB
MNRRHDRTYPIRIQSGIITVVVLLILLFNLNWQRGDLADFSQTDPDPIVIDDIDRTIHIAVPPAPPRPVVPVPVPDTEIPDDIPIFTSELNPYDQPFALPDIVEEPATKQELYEWNSVELPPAMNGGAAALYSRITYPEMARNARIQGRVVIEFIVDRQGNVRDARVIRGIGGGADEEAVRALSSMTFTPGVQGGRVVEVRMRQIVTFRLQ